uniref:Uncharacterized protein n=1 Tax=Anguilla anguilla TaxID=7936 RepID=A0A0E9WQ40_ANGAN
MQIHRCHSFQNNRGLMGYSILACEYRANLQHYCTTMTNVTALMLLQKSARTQEWWEKLSVCSPIYVMQLK